MSNDRISAEAERGAVADGWQGSTVAYLLGYAPLLAASQSWQTGLALGLAAAFVVLTTHILAALMAGSIIQRYRLPVFAIFATALVTSLDLYFQAEQHELYLAVGLFVPLIMVNGYLLQHAVFPTSESNLRSAVAHGLGYGAGLTALLTASGALRASISPSVNVASLPAGALLMLAAFLAVRQYWLDRHRSP